MHDVKLVALILVAVLLISACQPVLLTESPQPQQGVTELASSEPVSGFVDNDGVHIHYEAEGQGPPLVLMHWASGSMQDWKLFGYVDALKDDYRLILIDMRGHGQSDKPLDPQAYAPEIQVKDVTMVLDALDVDRAHYFGYSLGAALGWALADSAPERFLSFVLGGDGPGAYDASGEIQWMRNLGATGMAREVQNLARIHGPTSDMLNSQIYDAYAANDTDAVLLALEQLSKVDVSSSLPQIEQPILLIGVPSDSDYDDVVTAMAKLPDAELLISDYDHAGTFMGSHIFVPQIIEFLEEGSDGG